MTNRITGHYRDGDDGLDSFGLPHPLPLDVETRHAALMRLFSDLAKLGYDAWPQNGGINITNRECGVFVRYRVELLGQHVFPAEEPGDE